MLSSSFLLSSVLSAGANLHGAGTEAMHSGNGIIPPMEVSAMDFRGTMLVVLSACETVLGNVRQSKGVYSFRRDF